MKKRRLAWGGSLIETAITIGIVAMAAYPFVQNLGYHILCIESDLEISYYAGAPGYGGAYRYYEVVVGPSTWRAACVYLKQADGRIHKFRINVDKRTYSDVGAF